MARPRRTLARPVTVSGIGLHTGRAASVTIGPAASGTGRRFVRRDLPGAPEVPAHAAYAAPDGADRRTVLAANGARVESVEHVLAALAGLGIDDARLVVDGAEVPDAGDGSAAPFVEALRAAGLAESDARVEPLVLECVVEVRDGAASLRATPAAAFSVHCVFDHPHAAVGRQERSQPIDEERFVAEIAPARTFGFLEEAEALWARGLARGASMRNAVVIGPDGPVNGAWRYADECVRHKILDLIGDLALLGRPLVARVDAVRPGHRLNVRFVEAMLEAIASGARA